MGVDVGVSRRVTLAEAAQVLGVTKEAVRKRAQRGTLRSDKDPDGRVYVYLPIGKDTGKDAVGADERQQPDPRDRLIATLQEQLEAERAANRENRRLLAAALERIPAIESPEATEDPETAPEEQERGEVPEEPESEPQPRSWWRRWFGG